MMKATIGAALVLFLVLAGIASAQDLGDAAKGVPAYQLCAACHSLRPGVHLSGPSLAGAWGKRAATASDYSRYSQALKHADIVWDENTLNAWLAEPQAMVPGTAMQFRGIKQNETRGTLIEFLRLALAPGGADKVVKDGLISAGMADGQLPQDLSSAEPDRQIKEVRHCRDAYYITTANGSALPYWETNVRIKIDGSARGPRDGKPVLLNSGMAGDRISIVFSSLAELKALLAEKC